MILEDLRATHESVLPGSAITLPRHFREGSTMLQDVPSFNAIEVIESNRSRGIVPTLKVLVMDGRTMSDGRPGTPTHHPVLCLPWKASTP